MLNWTVRNKIDYLYKMDLALNNLQNLICHKTQPTNKPTLVTWNYVIAYENTKFGIT